MPMNMLLAILGLLVLTLAAGCTDDEVTRPVPGPAPTVKVEAEDKTDQFDRGFTNIQIVDRPGASGGKAVEGLDKILEWIDIPIRFEQSGVYNVAFRHASKEGVSVVLTVMGAGLRGEDIEWSLSLNSGGCG